MADGQEDHRLAGMQPQGALSEDGDSAEETRSRKESTDCPEMDRERPGHAEATLPVSQRQREKSLGGLVQQFEQAVGDFQQVLTPGVADIPDKFAAVSLDASAASPLRTVSSQPSPIFSGDGPSSPGVRITGNDKAHVELVTEAMFDSRLRQLTHAMHEHFAQAIHEELASLEARLHAGLEACAARCEALESKGGEHGRDLERHRDGQRGLADQIDGLQRQLAEQDQRVAQELEQLGQASGQALDGLRLIEPRLDGMAQDQRESVEALELADRQLVARLETFTEQTNLLQDSRKAQEQECKALQQQVKDMHSQMQQTSEQDNRLRQHIDTEMERLEGMLHGPAPSVESDLQKIFEDMEDFKGKLHVLNQVQIQDQNDFLEVDQFQKELNQRMNDEMKLLRGKVDEVTDMVQEDLMGLHSKLCSDLDNLQADREAADADMRQGLLSRSAPPEPEPQAAPSVADLPSPGTGAAPVEEPADNDDDCRWELQHRALSPKLDGALETNEIGLDTNEAHSEVVTEAEQGAPAPPGEQPPEHNEQPPEVVPGSPPPLAYGSLAASLVVPELEKKRVSIFQNTLPAEETSSGAPTPQPAPQRRPTSFGLAELQRKMDEKLDMSLRQVDEYIARHEVQLQQLGEVGNQYAALQRGVDELREEVGSVRGDLDGLRSCKVLNHLRAIPDL